MLGLDDVFLAIAGDEKAHVATMNAVQDRDSVLRSPNTERLVLLAATAAIAAAASLGASNGNGLDGLGDALDGVGDVIDRAGGIKDLLDIDGLVEGATAGLTGLASLASGVEKSGGVEGGVEETAEAVNWVAEMVRWMQRLRP